MKHTVQYGHKKNPPPPPLFYQHRLGITNCYSHHNTSTYCKQESSLKYHQEE